MQETEKYQKMSNLNLNKVILCGRLAAAPELKMTPAGVPVCSFRLAVNRSYSKDGEQAADFITCVAWRQRAEFIAKYFGRGSSLCLAGSIQVRKYADQNGNTRYSTEVLVDDAHFVDSKAEGGSAAGADCSSDPGEFVPVDDGPLPF